MAKLLVVDEAIKIACIAVSMDKVIDMKTKHAITDTLSHAEKLARIGQATIKMFAKCEVVGMITTEYDPIADDEYAVCKTEFLTIDELIAWAESEV